LLNQKQLTFDLDWHRCESSNTGEEVTLDSLITIIGTHKPGCIKVKFCAEQADLDGLKYFWVDTRYIDKADFTELSEATTIRVLIESEY
jgi:hypothetical protein